MLTLRFHITQVRIVTIKNVGEMLRKKEPLNTVGETANECSSYGNQYGSSSSKNKN
jgi:hypothetical protein